MTAPAWGCPWHGKVQGGQLSLPNGDTLAWPGVLAESRRSGDTALLSVPGVPPVTRSETELADDQAAGRQWWDRAIISSLGTGGRLHGKALGGWVYCAPDGGRWRVSAPLSVRMWHFSGISWTVSHANRFSGSVSLSRFGDLAGQPKTLSRSVLVSDLTLGRDYLPSHREGYLQLRDISPDGSRAIYALICTTSPPTSVLGDHGIDGLYRAAVFLEVVISGAGDAIGVEMSVIRSYDQIGRRQVVVRGDLDDMTWYAIRYDVSSREAGTGLTEYTYTARLETSAESPGLDVYMSSRFRASGEGLGAMRSGSTVTTTTHTYLAGMWYAEDGALQEVVLRLRSVRTLTLIAPSIAVGGTRVQLGDDVVSDDRSVVATGNDSSEAVDYLARLEVDGVPLVEVGNSWSRQVTQRYEYFDGQFIWSGTDSELGPISGMTPNVGESQGWTTFGSGGLPADTDIDVGVGGTYAAFGCPYDANVYLSAYEHSNHCWSLMRSDRLQGALHWSACATPSATVDDGLSKPWDGNYGAPAVRLYGSWCPVTHAVARDAIPLCWT